MDFVKIHDELKAHPEDTLAQQKILKAHFTAKSVDIFFYDDEKKAFFDKINQTRIYTKFLDETSIIGRVYIEKRRLFIEDIRTCKFYHTAIDNPFKLEVLNELVIPIVEGNTLKGFIRWLGLAEFSHRDLIEMSKLNDAFEEMFTQKHSLNENERVQDNAFVDRVKIFSTITQMKKLYNVLSDNARNQEVEKLIEEGRQNLNNIYTYLNPNFEHVSKIQQVRQNIDRSQDKNVNILIADDLKINVQILKSMLSVDSVINHIKLAYDGVEAIEVLEESSGDAHESIHVIFLDHHMPGKLGTEIANEIKLGKEGKNDIIIVSITNDKEVIEQNKDIYDYHLPKPFTKDNVVRIMNKIKSEKLLSH